MRVELPRDLSDDLRTLVDKLNQEIKESSSEGLTLLEQSYAKGFNAGKRYVIRKIVALLRERNT